MHGATAEPGFQMTFLVDDDVVERHYGAVYSIPLRVEVSTCTIEKYHVGSTVRFDVVLVRHILEDI